MRDNPSPGLLDGKKQDFASTLQVQNSRPHELWVMELVEKGIHVWASNWAAGGQDQVYGREWNRG